MATLTPALTPYTCALACVESWFSDIAHPLDQRQILKRYPQYLTNPDPAKRHEYGATNEEQIVALCRDEGFTANYYKDFRHQIVEKLFADTLATNGCVLFCALWMKRTNHCVRLTGITAPGKYEVMNPSYGNAALSPVTFDELVEWGFRFVLVTT
jgi:hypothetical protein